jgi:hypothetical protein
MPATLAIRPVADSDHAAVRELFIAINWALAPADMRETFERYIETALAAAIGRPQRPAPGRHGRPRAGLAARGRAPPHVCPRNSV